MNGTSLKQRLNRAVIEFGSNLANTKSGALVQVWMPEQCSDGTTVLSAQGLPFAVVGVGDLLALFRCVSVRYRFSTDITRPSLMGAIGRVFSTMEPEMSRDVQKYDKQVYLRVSEAQRCRVHSSLMVPIFERNQTDKPLAVLELVQSDKDIVFPEVMSWLAQSVQAVGLSTVSLEQEGPQAAGLRDYSMHVDQTLKGVTEGAREAARNGGEGSAERAPWNAAPAASTVAPNGAQQGTSGSGKAGASGGEDQTSGPALARTSTTGYEPTPGAQAPQSAAQMQQLMSLITAKNLNPNMIPSLQAMVAASSASAAAAGNSASGAAASGQSLTTAQLHQALAQALIAQGGGSGARGGGGAAGMSGVVKNEQGTEEGDDDALGAASDGDEDDDSDGDENGGRGNHKNRADGGAGKRLRFEDLQAQFGLGLKEAAANLGICATTLKRACRRHGIKRWPRRQIVKLSKALTQMGYSGPPPPGLIQTAATAALSQVPEPAPAPQPLTTAQLQQQQQQQLVALLSTGNAPAGASKAAGAGNGAPKAPQQPQAPGSATAGSAAAAIAMHPLLASLGGQMPGAAPQPPQAPQAAPSALASQAAAAMLMQQQQAMQSAQGGTANTMLMMQQMLSRGGNGASAMPAAQPNDVNMMLAMQHAALMQQQQRQQQQHPQSQPHHMQHQLQQQAQQQPPPQQQRQMHPMSMQPQQPALDAAGGGGGGQPLVSSSSSLQGAALPPMHFMYGDGPLGTAANTAMVPALVHELDGEGGAGAMQTSRSGLGGNGLSKPGMGELGMGSSTLSIPTGELLHGLDTLLLGAHGHGPPDPNNRDVSQGLNSEAQMQAIHSLFMRDATGSLDNFMDMLSDDLPVIN